MAASTPERLEDDVVDAYLSRIGLSERPPVDATGLALLQAAHLVAVPFTNLDVYDGVPVSTDLEHSLTKIVAERRGGWCFENNGAFGALLASLGFDVLYLGAAVLLNGPTQTVDHLCLEVSAGGSWLVDVGFGDSFVAPLDLNSRVAQGDPAGTFELIDSSQGLTLTRHDTEHVPVPQYRFRRVGLSLDDLTPVSDALQADRSLDWSTKRFATRLLNSDGDRVTLTHDTLKISKADDREESPISFDAWEGSYQTWFCRTDDRQLGYS